MMDQMKARAEHPPHVSVGFRLLIEHLDRLSQFNESAGAIAVEDHIETCG